jgi:hypothetical protein
MILFSFPSLPNNKSSSSQKKIKQISVSCPPCPYHSDSPSMYRCTYTLSAMPGITLTPSVHVPIRSSCRSRRRSSLGFARPGTTKHTSSFASPTFLLGSCLPEPSRTQAWMSTSLVYPPLAAPSSSSATDVSTLSGLFAPNRHHHHLLHLSIPPLPAGPPVHPLHRVAAASQRPLHRCCTWLCPLGVGHCGSSYGHPHVRMGH